MSHPTLVLNLVGLHQGMITPATTHLYQFCQQGTLRPLIPVTPAVTCSVQSTFLTGTTPSSHGIVANGWYFRDLAQVWLWRQSNHLVAGEKVWDTAKRLDPKIRCANLFWWYNMYSSADFSVTPRPLYLADGRKIPDIYSHPAPLRDFLQKELGPFPSSIFGVHVPTNGPVNGLPMPVSWSNRNTNLIFFLFTFPIWTTANKSLDLIILKPPKPSNN